MQTPNPIRIPGLGRAPRAKTDRAGERAKLLWRPLAPSCRSDVTSRAPVVLSWLPVF